MTKTHLHSSLLLSALLCLNSACGSGPSDPDPAEMWKDKAYFFTWREPVAGQPSFTFWGKIWGCTVQESNVWLGVTGTHPKIGTIDVTGHNLTDLQLVSLVDEPDPVFVQHIAMEGTFDPPDESWCEIDKWTVTIQYQIDLRTRTASMTNPTALAGQTFTATCHSKGHSRTDSHPIPFVFAPITGIPLDLLTTEQCRADIRPGLGD
jgi:hypothetical protein